VVLHDYALYKSTFTLLYYFTWSQNNNSYCDRPPCSLLHISAMNLCLSQPVKKIINQHHSVDDHDEEKRREQHAAINMKRK